MEEEVVGETLARRADGLYHPRSVELAHHHRIDVRLGLLLLVRFDAPDEMRLRALQRFDELVE